LPRAKWYFEGVISLLLLLFAAAVPTLPWAENNYAKALAEAKARRVPVFVEVWAPW
jgi:hypothetical protein